MPNNLHNTGRMMLSDLKRKHKNWKADYGHTFSNSIKLVVFPAHGTSFYSRQLRVSCFVRKTNVRPSRRSRVLITLLNTTIINSNDVVSETQSNRTTQRYNILRKTVHKTHSYRFVSLRWMIFFRWEKAALKIF